LQIRAWTATSNRDILSSISAISLQTCTRVTFNSSWWLDKRGAKLLVMLTKDCNGTSISCAFKAPQEGHLAGIGGSLSGIIRNLQEVEMHRCGIHMAKKMELTVVRNGRKLKESH
jgi:hypothetical protein